MLLFGRNRFDHFPDAWVQIGHFAGFDKARIRDHAELKPHPIVDLEEAIAFIRSAVPKLVQYAAMIGGACRWWPPLAFTLRR